MKRDSNRIYVSGPSITDREEQYVLDAVRNAWYDDANIFQEKFEKAFRKHTNRKYAVALPSCTSALHLSLEALGIQEGDQVIVPDLTWIATVAPLKYVGATPIFADIEKDSWCISAKSIREKITEKTKAIITVDLYGNMPNYIEIEKMAKEFNISIIEDAAEAAGSTYMKRPAGNFGIVGTFSFHGSKMLTTGEGGMLVTDDEMIYKRVLKMRDHGRDVSSSKMFWNDEVGYKYKMSSMQAALGLAQVERIKELVEKKQEEFGWYMEELKDVPGLKLNKIAPEVSSNYWMVTCVTDFRVYDLTKEEIIEYLKEHNIDSRPIFYPLSQLPAFKKDKSENENTNAFQVGLYGVNLPSDINITREEVRRVCMCLKELLWKKRK